MFQFKKLFITAEEIKAIELESNINQVPPIVLLKAEKSVSVGIALTIKNNKHTNKFINNAKTEILFAAFGPKALVVMSIHRKDNHDIVNPPSIAIQSFW